MTSAKCRDLVPSHETGMLFDGKPNMTSASGDSGALQMVADGLCARTARVRRRMMEWGGRAGTFVKERPGFALVGAFAIGFLLAKVSRYA